MCYTHFSMCLNNHNEHLCVFRRYPRNLTIHMFYSFLQICTIIMSSFVFSGDIQDTQPSTFFSHFSTCLYSHIEHLCVFRRYPRYLTIHMFTHFSMCLYSHNEHLCVFRRYPRYSNMHVFYLFPHVPVQSK